MWFTFEVKFKIQKKTMFSLTKHYSHLNSFFPLHNAFKPHLVIVLFLKISLSLPLKVFLDLNPPHLVHTCLSKFQLLTTPPLGISNNLESLGGMNIFWNCALEKIPCVSEHLVTPMPMKRVPLLFSIGESMISLLS